MKIEWRSTHDLIPYGRNQKKHDEKQIQNVANSIKRFGWQQPIVIDGKDVVVIGHCRLAAALKLGLEQVPVTVADNLSEDEIRELRIVDNKTNESDWDMEALQIDLQELGFDGFDFEFDTIEGESVIPPEEDDKYTKTVNIPQYEIKGDCPEIDELCIDDKTYDLIKEIDESDVTDEEKEFLRKAAYRHTEFHYGQIAEYYAHATPEMQRLMENSALVIIDVDDAVANGYANLSESILEIMGADDEE